MSMGKLLSNGVYLYKIKARNNNSKTHKIGKNCSIQVISMDNNYKIILASQSPRRAEILRMIGVSFKVEPSNIHEEINQKIKQNEIPII